MKNSTASYGAACVTGCQITHATATHAAALRSVIRGGGGELVSRIATVDIYSAINTMQANVGARPVGQRTTIGPTGSTEASTGTSGNSTTPRRTWRRWYDDTWTRGQILRRMD
jgi:hypothetical protein